MKIINKRMIKMKNHATNIKSNRRPLCGGDLMTDGLKVKILEVIRRNQQRNNSISVTSRNANDEKYETQSTNLMKLPLI